MPQNNLSNQNHFSTRRKLIKMICKIPNTTHCDLLPSINSSILIIWFQFIQKMWKKSVWSCLTTQISIVTTVAQFWK